jgi:hypothetical protein
MTPGVGFGFGNIITGVSVAISNIFEIVGVKVLVGAAGVCVGVLVNVQAGVHVAVSVFVFTGVEVALAVKVAENVFVGGTVVAVSVGASNAVAFPDVTELAIGEPAPYVPEALPENVKPAEGAVAA